MTREQDCEFLRLRLNFRRTGTVRDYCCTRAEAARFVQGVGRTGIDPEISLSPGPTYGLPRLPVDPIWAS